MHFRSVKPSAVGLLQSLPASTQLQQYLQQVLNCVAEELLLCGELTSDTGFTTVLHCVASGPLRPARYMLCYNVENQRGPCEPEISDVQPVICL